MVRTIRENYIKLFLVSICIASFVCAGNDEEFFLRGNKYYAQKEYDSAFQAYDMISKKGRAVFYNMGNCLFYMQDYSRALAYWSRAEVGATPAEYQHIVRNKEQALKKIGTHKELSLWEKAVRSAGGVLPYVSLFLLQLFFIIFWWGFVFIARTKRTGSKKIILSCLSCCLGVFGFMLGVYSLKNSPNQALVVKQATLFAGPDKSFHVLSPVAYAENVTVKQAREGWYKIQYTDMIGWVEADVIQII